METARTNPSANGEMGSKQTLTGAEETGSGNAHAAEDGKDDVRPPAENGPTVSVQQPSSDPKPERRPSEFLLWHGTIRFTVGYHIHC